MYLLKILLEFRMVCTHVCRLRMRQPKNKENQCSIKIEVQIGRRNIFFRNQSSNKMKHHCIDSSFKEQEPGIGHDALNQRDVKRHVRKKCQPYPAIFAVRRPTFSLLTTSTCTPHEEQRKIVQFEAIANFFSSFQWKFTS